MNEPPLITISDPNRPAEPVDVLGPEREPWRPSRRQVQVLLVVLLVLAATVLPVLALRHRDAERAADRKSVTQVALSVPEDDGSQGSSRGVANLEVRNSGPTAVTIVRARVDRDGYHPQSAHVVLKAGDSAILNIAPESTCPSRLPRSGPTGVLLDVVTGRGARTTVRVGTASSSFPLQYQQAVQEQCHLYDVGASLAVSIDDTATEESRLLLHLSLTNQSAQPRSLVGIEPVDGFSFTTTPPLPVVVAAFPSDGVAVTATVTITRCAQAKLLVPRRSVDYTPVPTDGSVEPFGDGGFDGTALTGIVAGGGTQETTELFLGEDLAGPLADLVRQVCRV